MEVLPFPTECVPFAWGHLPLAWDSLHFAPELLPATGKALFFASKGQPSLLPGLLGKEVVRSDRVSDHVSNCVLISPPPGLLGKDGEVILPAYVTF